MITSNHNHPDAGCLALGDRSRHFRAKRISQPDQPDELEIKIMLDIRKNILNTTPSLSHAQNAQATVGHDFSLVSQAFPVSFGQVAKISNGFRCAFCRHNVLPAAVGFP